MSKEELHDFAISEIERCIERISQEPEGDFEYYLKGELAGMVWAYFQAGAISMEERNKYKS